MGFLVQKVTDRIKVYASNMSSSSIDMDADLNSEGLISLVYDDFDLLGEYAEIEFIDQVIKKYRDRLLQRPNLYTQNKQLISSAIQVEIIKGVIFKILGGCFFKFSLVHLSEFNLPSKTSNPFPAKTWT